MFRRAAYWLTFAIGMLAAGTCSFVVMYQRDPLSYWRDDGYYHARSDNQFKTIAGLVRSHRYDGIIVGSSLSGNFDSTIFEQGFDLQSVFNATAWGARIGERIAAAELALRYKPGLRVVFFEIKPFDLDTGCQPHSDRFPDYLYNLNPLDDVFYFVSAEMLWLSWRKTEGSWEYSTDIRMVNRWLETQASHLKDPVSRVNRLARELLATNGDVPRPGTPERSKAMHRQADCALAGLLPMIESHRDVRFIFYEPPEHPSLLWVRYRLDPAVDTIRSKLGFLRAIGDLPNAEFHDFGDNLDDMVLRCDVFVDLTHFLPNLGDELQRQIIAGTSRATAAEYEANVQSFVERLEPPQECPEAGL